ncbi:MAG TPA: SDR family oxidoreductase [Thermoanaerobaculia bacterium]|nr:SDR family oxidoreductase [Thermoanaerobaculia bacterium]
MSHPPPPSVESLERQVLDVFVEVTRYPEEILDRHAHLEEDLGIDSVKLSEILAVLAQTYDLPADLELPPERLRTIASATGALYEVLSANGNGSGNGSGNGAATALAAAAGPRERAVSPDPAVVAVPLAAAGRVADADAVRARVLEVFAEVTRYPAEILDPDADLEEDLGIDSVKLGEIFAVLAEEYDVPQQGDLPRDALRSISGISRLLLDHALSGGIGIAAAVTPPASTLTLPDAGAGADPAARTATASPGVAGGTLLDEVRAVFEEVTRYPAEILDAEAHLEEDLGIDSVKLGEVFAVLQDRYHLPTELDLPPEELTTIAGVSAALERYLGAATDDALARAPATTPDATPPIQARGPAPPAEVRATESAAKTLATSVRRPESDKPLAGKVGFVSGSGRGLGKEVASHLAQLGATVIVNSFHSRQRGEETAAEIERQGGDVLHLWGSVANPKHLDGIFDEIEERYGRLDFLVANASNGGLGRLEDITPQHWEKAFRTNVVGLHHSALRAVQLMRRHGGGKIVTLSSPAAHGHVEYFGCMGPVKAAVESLTRSMAVEFAGDNVQVVCVSPGPLPGELLDKWPERDRLIAQWERATPHERLCEARDVAHFIAYLLGAEVRLFNGSVLVLDGGISAKGF